MTVVPIHPHVRYYCSGCNTHFHEHEREGHANCIKAPACLKCGRQFALGDDACPVCGAHQEDLA